jgi:thiamine-phosphate pyrophosphorylase
MTVLPSPLYVVADADACERAGWSLIEFSSACFDAGARLLQVRNKLGGSRDFLDAISAIVRRAEPFNATVIVNDRADIARIAGASGVHVGQDDLAPAAVRALVGTEALVGLSTHTPGQIERAVREPVSYVAIGPVFSTATKATGYDCVGLSAVRDAAAIAGAVDLPLVAIGGITLEQAASVLAAGAQSVAVIGDLLATGDPAARVRRYLDLLKV